MNHILFYHKHILDHQCDQRDQSDQGLLTKNRKMITVIKVINVYQVIVVIK